ncbi:hypothetical protein HAX54_042534 [Datura stramonium]|uniref:Uncharacterized protein n=1 Tax=Datura stramonium TaxID=4076 RepID=A0ABS8VZJ7_DATST|nr:hypothetical protein [Datura stramonium]
MQVNNTNNLVQEMQIVSQLTNEGKQTRNKLRTVSIIMKVEVVQNWVLVHPCQHKENLIKETKNLSTNILPSSLLVVHDTGRGGQYNVTKLQAQTTYFQNQINLHKTGQENKPY